MDHLGGAQLAKEAARVAKGLADGLVVFGFLGRCDAERGEGLLVLDGGVAVMAKGVEEDKGGVLGVGARTVDDEAARCVCVGIDKGANDALAKRKEGDDVCCCCCCSLWLRCCYGGHCVVAVVVVFAVVVAVG